MEPRNVDMLLAINKIIIPYQWKKNGEKWPVKSDQFFSGDQYFYPTNNFPRLKLTPTKNFY